MSETPFAADFRALLAKHGITAPRFAYGAAAFDPAKPSCLYSGPIYGTDEMVAATAALVEGKWSVAGEHTRRFEQAFSRYLHQKESVMVNSGSSADLLMIAAAKARYGWEDGDGVIVSPVGFPTTISAITLNGLRPVFVDIEWDTLNADNDAIEHVLEQYPKDQQALRDAQQCIGDFVDLYIGGLGMKRSFYHGGQLQHETFYPSRPTIRAIFVSPVLGNPPDMDRLVELGARYGVKLLLDGCDSLGTTWRGFPLTTYVAASTCSFFPSHHISTIQGGMVSSQDTELIRIARSMSAWGKDCHCVGATNLLPNGLCGNRFSCWLPSCPEMVIDHRYTYTTDRAYNLQPPDLLGALGCVQMERLPAIHEARREAHSRLLGLMRLLPEVQTASAHAHAEPSWFGFAFICPDYTYKAALVAHLERAGVQTRNYFSGSITMQPGYAHLGRSEDQPNASKVLSRVFFIGVNPGWTDAHFNHIELTIKGFRKTDGSGLETRTCSV